MLPVYNILITVSACHIAFPFFLIKYLGSIRKSKTKNFRLIKQNQNFKYWLCTLYHEKEWNILFEKEPTVSHHNYIPTIYQLYIYVCMYVYCRYTNYISCRSKNTRFVYQLSNWQQSRRRVGWGGTPSSQE